ncbi:MAG: hypothetical protein KIT87_01915 [Anaerolineae bacterium]|nr:hypothetical protein [Anaerolineae bacterium]
MLCLRLLGPVQITRHEEAVPSFESRKALALLCYLVVRAQPVSRSHLAEMFWSGKTEAQGRANLSWTLHHILSRLPSCLKTDRHAVLFQPSCPVSIDTTTFQALTVQGDIDSLMACAELFRGEFMAEFELDDAPEFEIWLHREREVWRQHMAQVLQTLMTYQAARHDYMLSLDYASRLLKLEPWREEAHRCLMVLLARSGQRSAALAQYEICRRILAAELQVEPDTETTVLYEQIRSGAIKSPQVELRASSSAPASHGIANGNGVANGVAATRPLTVLACEFVGLVALAETLSIEKFHTLVCACRQACAEVIHHHGGYVAQYRGNGLLVYFGFPTPTQDAPLQAIEAGLNLVEIVGRYCLRLTGNFSLAYDTRPDSERVMASVLDPLTGKPLTIRIGIHTGEVMDSGETNWFGPASVVGAPLILAERLQTLAAPNSVLINQTTSALVEGKVDCEPLGLHRLEALGSPQGLYQVLGLAGAGRASPELQPVLALP